MVSFCHRFILHFMSKSDSVRVMNGWVDVKLCAVKRFKVIWNLASHSLFINLQKWRNTCEEAQKFFLIYSCADDVQRMPSKREQLILNGKEWLNITPKSNYYIIKAMLLSVLISIRTIDCTFEHSFAYMNSFKLYVCVCCLSWLSWSA